MASRRPASDGIVAANKVSNNYQGDPQAAWNPSNLASSIIRGDGTAYRQTRRASRRVGNADHTPDTRTTADQRQPSARPIQSRWEFHRPKYWACVWRVGTPLPVATISPSGSGPLGSAEHYLLAKLPKVWPRSQELHDIGVPERGEVCRVDVTSRERAESVLRRAGWNLRGPCSTRL